MFGIVLAMLKMSAWSWTPSAAASSAPRANPLIRLTTVPAAITALELSTLGEDAAPAPGSLTGRSSSRSSGGSLSGPPPAQSAPDPAPGDHHDQQRDAGTHDRPDQDPDLAAAHRERDRGADLGTVDGDRGQGGLTDADPGGGGRQPHGGALLGQQGDRLVRCDQELDAVG